MERHIGRVQETDAALEALRVRKDLSPAALAEGLSSIGLQYSGMALHEKALQILGEAVDAAAPAGDVALAKARLCMGKARLRMTLVASAQEHLHAATVLVKELGPGHQVAIDAQVSLVACKVERGLLAELVSCEEVEALVQAARDTKATELLCNALLCAGDFYDYAGKAVSARRRVEEAIKMARLEGSPLAPILGAGLLRLGTILADGYDDYEAAMTAFAEAVEVLRSAIGEDHPTCAFARGRVGCLQARMEAGRRNQARNMECCDEEECACEGAEDGSGGACCEGGQGECCPPEGQKEGEEEAQFEEKDCDEGRKDKCCAEGGGECCVGETAEDGQGPLPGVDALEEALARCERVYGRSCRQVLMLLGSLAIAKSDGRDHDTALALSKRELEMAKELYTEHSRAYAEAVNCQALFMAFAELGDEALVQAERCIALHREILPPGHPDLAVVILNYLAEAGHLDSSAPPESVLLLKEVAAIQAKAEFVPLSQSSPILIALAEIAQREGDVDETCRLLVLEAENHLRIKGADAEETLEAVCNAAEELANNERRGDAQDMLILALSKQRLLPEILSDAKELTAALEAFAGDKASLLPLMELLGRYAAVLSLEKLTSDAILMYQNALVLCQFLGGDPEQVADLHVSLASVYRIGGDTANAMLHHASAAVNYRAEALLGGWTEKGLSNEVDLGCAQVKAGIDVAKAVEALKFAAEELTKMDTDADRLESLLSNVADVYEEIGEDTVLLEDAFRYRTLCVSLLTSLTDGERMHDGLSLALFRQAACMRMIGQDEEAKGPLRKAIEIASSSGDGDGLLLTLTALARLLVELEEFDDAMVASERLMKETEKLHGADSLQYSSALMQVAHVQQELEEGEKALKTTEQALQLVRKHAPGHWNIAKVHKARSTAYASIGNVAAALDEAKLAVEVLRNCVQQCPDNDQLKDMLADYLSELGQFQAGVRHDFLGAQKSFEDALATRMSTNMGDCPQVAMDHVLLGSICKQLGQVSAGRAHAQEAARVAKAAYQGQPHPVVGQVLLALSEFATDPHERIATLTEVASIFMMTIGDAPDTADVLVKLGQAFVETNQAKKGRAVLERAWRMLRDVAGPQDELTVEVYGFLTQLYHELGIPGQPDPNPHSGDSSQPPAA